MFIFFRFLPDIKTRDHLGEEKVEKLQQDEGEYGLLQKAWTIGRKQAFLYCSVAKGGPSIWPHDSSHFLHAAIDTKIKTYSLTFSLLVFPSHILI